MLNITNRIEKLEWHPYRTWEKRSLDEVSSIVIHQALSNADVESINKYHIMPGQNNHLSTYGAPHFAYHYGIERDGLIITANMLEDITWHTRSQNREGIGIMLVGDFSGEGHTGNNSPTFSQFLSLEKLVDMLVSIFSNIKRTNVFGHADFGKPACPGYEIMEFIKDYRYE